MVVFFLLLSLVLYGDEPTVEFWFEESRVQEETPVRGNLILSHSEKESVDRDSFRFDEKKIEPDLLTKKKIGTSLIETYQFTLSPMRAGEYKFQGVRVKVGGSWIESRPASLTVFPITNKEATPLPSGGAFLEITPFLEMAENLYPGMEIVCGYRYRFRGAIALKEEVIPLIDDNPFEKRGEKIIQDSVDGGYSIRTVKQRFRVVSPKVYKIPESFISGYSYVEKGGGGKILVEPKIVSKIAPFSITVHPFPEKGKPPFFSGILGPFSVDLALLSPKTVALHEPITVRLSFEGGGEKESIIAPNIACQPGFSYLFSIKEKEGFLYELSPRIGGEILIPEIYIATFDPNTGGYDVVATKPIPITVTTSLKEEAPAVTAALMNAVPYHPEKEWEKLPALYGQEAMLFYEKGYLPEALYLLRKENRKRKSPEVTAKIEQLEKALLVPEEPFPTRWSNPFAGQLLRPAFLYKSPHLLAPKVGKVPLPAGLEVEIVEVVMKGHWLKVRTGEETVGFLPYEAVVIF